MTQTVEKIKNRELVNGVDVDKLRFGGVRMEIPPDGLVLEEVERGLLEEALRRHGGNQSAAARFLGITRQTLIYRMRKFGLS